MRLLASRRAVACSVALPPRSNLCLFVRLLQSNCTRIQPRFVSVIAMGPKRKRSSAAANVVPITAEAAATPKQPSGLSSPPLKRRASQRALIKPDPDAGNGVVDGDDATRASPDSAPNPKVAPSAMKTKGAAPIDDPEAEVEDDDVDEDDIKQALSRPPAVNSDYLPLPWKGRLGYVRFQTA